MQNELSIINAQSESQNEPDHTQNTSEMNLYTAKEEVIHNDSPFQLERKDSKTEYEICLVNKFECIEESTKECIQSPQRSTKSKNAWNHNKEIKIGSLWWHFTLSGLKNLDLSNSLIGNSAIKYISESSTWTQLEVLVLNNIALDHNAAKYLGTNESWINLQELHLVSNPLIGEKGAMNLSLNKTWKNINKLLLNGSNVGILGNKFLKRNRVWKSLTEIQCDLSKRNEKLICSESMRFNDNDDATDQLGKYPKGKIKVLKNDTHRRRGGGRDGEAVENGIQVESIIDTNESQLADILSKIDQYKKRVLNDNKFENELYFYIDMLGKYSQDNHTANIYPFEVEYEVKKRLLNPNSESKVLLLAGEAGIGKTILCKYLQKTILSREINSDDRGWLPIYINTCSLENSRSSSSSLFSTEVDTSTTFEIICKELHLTKAEISLLQEAHASELLPHFLLIFDECALFNETLNKPLHSYTEDDCIQNNFCLLRQSEAL